MFLPFYRRTRTAILSASLSQALAANVTPPSTPLPLQMWRWPHSRPLPSTSIAVLGIITRGPWESKCGHQRGPRMTPSDTSTPPGTSSKYFGNKSVLVNKVSHPFYTHHSLIFTLYVQVALVSYKDIKLRTSYWHLANKGQSSGLHTCYWTRKKVTIKNACYF